MNDHDAIYQRLNDYADGALEPNEVGAVDSHLQACEVCRAELEAIRALLAEAERLPRSIEPPRDLWPDIDRQLEAERTDVQGPIGLRGRTLWSARYPLAAAAVLLIAASSLITAWLVGWSGVEPGARYATQAEVSLVREWRATEAEYLRASLELAESLEALKGELSPETVELIERNLQIIDDAIRESRAAFSIDPQNRELMETLSANYEKKLQVLRQVSRLSASL